MVVDVCSCKKWTTILLKSCRPNSVFVSICLWLFQAKQKHLCFV